MKAGSVMVGFGQAVGDARRVDQSTEAIRADDSVGSSGILP